MPSGSFICYIVADQPRYYREVLLESKFYVDLLGKYCFIRSNVDCSWILNNLKVMLKDKLVPTKPHDIVCYGIGSIQESKNAQFQFVLAILLRDLLKVG